MPQKTPALRAQYQREYRVKNKKVLREKANVRRRIDRKLYPEKHKKFSKRFYDANAERLKAIHRAVPQSVKYERHRKWLAKPGKRAILLRSIRKYQKLPQATRPEPSNCECCSGPPMKHSLHLDHCHVTGAFRGWLCMKCNTAIGKLGDDLPGVLRAVAYLLKTVAATTTTTGTP